MSLTDLETRRYAAHLRLPSVGEAGQIRLKNAKILCVGAGGLGSPSLLYLAAAGIGTLGIVDDDVVDESNLQRQILYSTASVGTSKAHTAQQRLQELNPYVTVNVHHERLTAENAEEILSQYQMVLDGSDNFATRYLVNHFCVKLKIVLVSASVAEFRGQCSVFVPGGACYQCLFPQSENSANAPNCNTQGVLGVLPGLLGTVQAAEAIKVLLGIGQSLAGRLLQLDLLTWEKTVFQISKDPACPVCSGVQSAVFVERPLCNSENSISAEQLRSLLQTRNVHLLDVRDFVERQTFHIGGTHLPLAQLESGCQKLVKDGLWAVYCQSGIRSRQAVEILVSQGFQAVSLAGGLRNWRSRFGNSNVAIG